MRRGATRAIRNRAHYRREDKKTPPKQEGERKQEPTQCTGGSDRHLIPSGNEFSQATQRAGNPLEGRSGAGDWSPPVAGALACGQAVAFLGFRTLWGLGRSGFTRSLRGLLRQTLAWEELGSCHDGELTPASALRSAPAWRRDPREGTLRPQQQTQLSP